MVALGRFKDEVVKRMAYTGVPRGYDVILWTGCSLPKTRRKCYDIVWKTFNGAELHLPSNGSSNTKEF